MQINQEGWMLIPMFVFLLATIAIGLKTLRRGEDVSALSSGTFSSALGFLGAEPAPLLLIVFPALLISGGTGRIGLYIGLLLGACLYFLLGKRLRALCVQSDAQSLLDLIDFRLGPLSSIVGAAALSLFSILLASGMIALLARLFFAVFSLAYTISVLCAAALVILYTSLLSRITLKWRGVVKGALLLVGLCAMAAYTMQGNGDLPALLVPSQFSPLQLLSDICFSLGMFALPLMFFKHAHPSSEAVHLRSMILSGILLLVAIAASYLLGISALATGGQATDLAGAELFFTSLAMDGFEPLFAGLLLVVPLCIGLYGGAESLFLMGDGIRFQILPRLWPDLSARAKSMVATVIALAAALIAMVPALNEQTSVFLLFSTAFCGLCAAFAPLVLCLCLGKQLKPLGAILGITLGSAVSLIWGLIPALSSLFTAFLPGFLFGIAGLLLGNKLQADPAPAKDAPVDAAEETREV